MANDTNKIKLLVLWDILCKNTDENHAMNSDEIREELAKRGISVMRKVVATDIAALNKYGYEVLSYKKKYYYYYVVSRPLETAEVVMLADVIKASKLTSTQKNIMIEKLSGTLCSHQAENLSKHIISLDKSRKGSSSLIYNVDAIERGIEENKQISFLYFDYDEKHKKVYRKNGDRYDRYGKSDRSRLYHKSRERTALRNGGRTNFPLREVRRRILYGDPGYGA